MYNPLEEFEVYKILKINNNWEIIINRILIYMLIGLVIISILKIKENLSSKKIIKSGYSTVIYENSTKVLTDIIGEKNKKILPSLKVLFIFILINNIIGLIPYSYTTTTNISVNLTLSTIIVLGITLYGLFKYNWKFILLFKPSGLTGYTRIIIPLIFLIEIVSYYSRIISLTVRLCANMVSGHILLHIIAFFAYQIPEKILILNANITYMLYFIPLLILIALYFLELGVAFIQSYVFVVLTTIYVKDILEEPGHNH